MSYDQALARLQEIVKYLESEEAISVEDYKKLALEAKELLVFCRNQLTQIEGEMEQIFVEK